MVRLRARRRALRHSLRWLVARPGYAALLGLAGGPLAFRAGEALGAVAFGANRVASFISLAVVWGVAMPVLAVAARRLGGSQEPQPQQGNATRARDSAARE
jgi:hypothetical protein